MSRIVVDILQRNGNLDADLGKVCAGMQALQIKEKLDTQSFGLGNQWQQLLLSLFKWERRHTDRRSSAIAI